MAERVPLFPIGGVLFPGVVAPLHVFEERYRTLVHDLLEQDEPRTFGMVAIREGHEVGTESVRSLYDVGCLVVIDEVRRLPDGRFALTVVGADRLRVLGLDRSRTYLQADVELLDEPSGGAVGPAAADVRTAFASYSAALGAGEEAAELPGDPTTLSYAVAAAMAIDLPERQALLEAPDTAGRLGAEARLLARELALVRELRAMPAAKPPLPPQSLN